MDGKSQRYMEINQKSDKFINLNKKEYKKNEQNYTYSRKI